MRFIFQRYCSTWWLGQNCRIFAFIMFGWNMYSFNAALLLLFLMTVLAFFGPFHFWPQLRICQRKLKTELKKEKWGKWAKLKLPLKGNRSGTTNGIKIAIYQCQFGVKKTQILHYGCNQLLLEWNWSKVSLIQLPSLILFGIYHLPSV